MNGLGFAGRGPGVKVKVATRSNVLGTPYLLNGLKDHNQVWVWCVDDIFVPWRSQGLKVKVRPWPCVKICYHDNSITGWRILTTKIHKYSILRLDELVRFSRSFIDVAARSNILLCWVEASTSTLGHRSIIQLGIVFSNSPLHIKANNILVLTIFYKTLVTSTAY